ncbi:MAG: tetratricopeptide repeat protein, partial [Candidatus Obscuribacterales bacterium]|nr:tetratricopeptide repeat protein [Candidatus Obscuribacterales bacterium]
AGQPEEQLEAVQSSATARGSKKDELWDDACKKVKTKQFSDAIPVLSQLIAKNNNPALAHTLRAKSWLALGKLDKAAADAAKAVALNNNLALAHTILGFCKLQENNLAAAMQAFSKAIDLEPKNIEARSLRALCKMAKRDPKSARDDLDVVLTADPDNLDALFNRAKANIMLSNWDAVKTDSKKMISINSAIPEGHMCFALALENTGDGYKSVPEYQKAAVCFSAFNVPDQTRIMEEQLVRLIPMYDYGRSKTPLKGLRR